jgi:GNAT superfamily N-acetyltransferase
VDKSLYSQYIAERTDDHILEAQRGFVTYRFINDGKSLYIIDIFVLPDTRRWGLATCMADRVVEIARKRGCTELLGTVVPSANGSTTSLMVLMGYGMTLKSASDNLIVFSKEIKPWEQ